MSSEFLNDGSSTRIKKCWRHHYLQAFLIWHKGWWCHSTFGIYYDKVQIFWESHKNLKNSSNFSQFFKPKQYGDFFTSLWPSQNIWTLHKHCTFIGQSNFGWCRGHWYSCIQIWSLCSKEPFGSSRISLCHQYQWISYFSSQFVDDSQLFRRPRP